MSVVRVATELHHTGELESKTKNVENLSVRMNTNQKIGHRHKLKIPFFSVGEEDFRFPDCLDQLRICQIKRFFERL